MRFLTASRNWVGLVLLIVTFTSLKQRASAQTGFLSLDCGARAPYVDEKGISWVPDDTYMSSGKIASINLARLLDPVFHPDLKELRYFPDVTRTRYCYSLPTTIGQNYFIRASFFHGLYDNSPEVKFDAALDVYSTRITINLDAEQYYDVIEYYFRAYKESTQYCLFRLPASGTPFISSLELRPLENSMYAKVADGSALILEDRMNFGGTAVVRYPDDPFDRNWATTTLGDGITTVNSTFVLDTGYAMEKPPPAVMNTAMSFKSTNAYIYYYINPRFQDTSFIINVYLAELQPLVGANRMFEIEINDVVVSPNVNIFSDAGNMNFKPVEYSFNVSTIGVKGQLNVTLRTTGLSTNPAPLWNAVEFISVHKKLPGTFADDVGAIEGLKKAFGLGAMWVGDPCLPSPYDWLLCNTDASPRVTAVKLSNASLSGQIPDLRALTGLTILHLDNNQLKGRVPDWLASLPNLKELHLQNNALTGSVPKALLNLPGLSLRVDGNPGLCTNASCPTDEKKSNVGIIVGAVVGALVAVGIAVAVTVVLCRRRRRPTDDSGKKPFTPPVSESVMEDGTTARGSRYTLAQVMTATNRNAKLLGRGGFGPVYYGILASGQEVAVKVAAKGSNQGSKEFINEIELLTRVHHKNLVSLVGYCDEGDNLILLYEYMSKGTVQEHLYGVGDHKRNFFLDWKSRLQIALNAAQGLEYLHVGCHPVIFHRDVKSNNILLNDKLVAKVADFGLSKSGESKDNVTHMSTMVKGTIGYLDPEYYMTNQLTDKSDVYGFGVFLLELICARPPFIQQLPEDQRRIDQWVRPYLENGTIEEIVDPALAGQYNLEAMWKVADLAMQSVEPKGKHRPNMSTVVQELRSAAAIENLNESSSSIAPPAAPAPANGQEKAPAFRFDIPESETMISDPQYGANPPISAR